MQRRDFLIDVVRLSAICAGLPNDWRLTWRPTYTDNPFALGVASGDPWSTGAVLWTRVAPRPLEPHGGMPGNRPVVVWEVAEDEAFTKIVKQGRYTAAPELSYSVHVEVDGLAPDRWYFYRFQSGEAMSPVGRVRTTPADGVNTPLRFGVASCANYEQGLFTAYDHLATERCDLVTHLGDYIYEYGGRDQVVRSHVGREIISVDDYRVRYAQYKMDPALQAAHAMCPWLVTWDDHEIDNNYANEVGENRMESAEQMRARRAAGYQAWWEHQPVRVPRARSWADLDIRRTTNWGALARFWMLDTRQYRDDQACDDGNRNVPCGDWDNPARSILGAQQERWLTDGLGESRARWQVLGQQVMMAPYDEALGPDQRVSMDQWSGYPRSRERILGAIAERAPNRTVVLTGDIHSNWVNELHAGFDRAERPVVAAEFVGTSIASGGDGYETSEVTRQRIAELPYIKWQTGRRGYYVCDVNEREWRTDYREVEFVTRPGAPVRTASQWRVEHGRAGIQRVG